MERRLREVLEGSGENYILPFFWQHGESRELLVEGMEKIHACGIGAVCVESRPHPDFLGDGWWRDMDIIMDRARELGMRVWVLDDAHFPSGYCNGQIGKDSPHRKQYLTRYTVDVVGPMREASFLVKLEKNETFVGAVAARRDRKNERFMGELLDISACRRGDFLEWDVPEGFWCVTVLKITDQGTGRPGYINPLDREAVRFFLDTVYEPHYARYGTDFGKTFAGFFSDEPEIGNVCGEYGHNACIGQATMNLPWSRQLEQMLKAKWGNAFCKNLIALWQTVDGEPAEKAEKKSGRSEDWDTGIRRAFLGDAVGQTANRTGELRAEFMDYVTQCYGANFCGQIGEWCRAHGVEYIGHVIEDGGTHARLGLGTGHYFRALWGQDMAGIDVVLQQIRPQLDDTGFYRIGGKELYYGEFFHHGLAKMGASLGHIDPKKKGRTMCEVFGAYGWAEGVKGMKWLVDHMLVRGVNYYVPHAFTMKDFPDPDCPPHFYARGKNPQFPYFGELMRYLNRVCHLIDGGIHRSCAAILYTADLEWMDRRVMQFETVGRILAQNQVDYEVLPVDLLLPLTIHGGKLACGAPVYEDNVYVGREEVGALILPECGCVPRKLADWCREAIEEGFSILSIHALPKILEEDGTMKEWEAARPEVVELDELGEVMKKRTAELTLSHPEPYLRYYHYIHREGEYYLFFNESVTDGAETEVTLPVDPSMSLVEYDPWDNRLKSVVCKKTAGGIRIPLSLSAYEMKIICVCADSGMAASDQREQALLARIASGAAKEQTVEGPWKLFLKKAGEDLFIYEKELFALKNITSSAFLPDFSGTMKYETTVVWPERGGEKEQKEQNRAGECVDGENRSDQEPDSIAYLDLGDVYETADVWVNGVHAGCRIAPPYRFEVGRLLQPGKNRITVLVTNTLVHQQKDALSMTLPVEPSGLLGPVRILF